jgi:hypothetical protein
MKPSPWRNIVLIWLGWAVVILSFQTWVQMRINLKRPDTVLNWTSSETGAASNDDQPYLLEPFLNSQVAWDSEFYLAIAEEGYNAAGVRAIPGDFTWGIMRQFCNAGQDADCFSLSYAFFPVYSFLTRAVSLPLALTPLARPAQVVLAAVIVSLLGALGAMLGLFLMVRRQWGDEAGVRAGFYLLIFPTGFYLAQVYSEGVFIGLTFGALGLLAIRKWGWAALLAAAAAWARPGGAILVLPMLIVWIMDRTWHQPWRTAILRGLAALSPALSFAIWAATPLADRFFKVEELFFHRAFFVVDSTLEAWQHAWRLVARGAEPTRFYYGLEFAAIFLGIIACIAILRSRPELALYGLAMITFALTTGAPQGMVRYVLSAPPIFLVLSRLGKFQAFDRVWTILSILIMGLQLTLFTFDFWVA